MAASYPASIPTLTNPTSGDDLDTAGVEHATQHANVNDEIEAIATELGVNPSGSDATVVARLDRHETTTYTTVTSFTNSWIDAAISGYAPVSYSKDAAGFVRLRGFVKSGTNGNPCFTLPAGFRPQYKTPGTGFEVQSSGAVTMTSTAQTNLEVHPSFLAYS